MTINILVILLMLGYWVTFFIFDRQEPGTWVKLALVGWLTALTFFSMGLGSTGVFWVLIVAVNLVAAWMTHQTKRNLGDG